MSISFFDDFKVLPDDPAFYPGVFSAVARQLKEKKEKNPLKLILLEEFDNYSIRLEKSLFQESCSVRTVLRARQLAHLLINDAGELELPLLSEAIAILKKHCFFLGPDRQYDSPRQRHLLKSLEILLSDKDLQKELKLVSRPYSHKIADQILRETLRLSPNHALTDAHAKRAVLAAWFCYLRQNVGSCFATAPAIVVQSEQPHVFIKDIQELLNTGRIKRTFGGVEYIVPLSSSWGAGEFKKHVLLNTKDKETLNNLGYSPGLLYAFESLGLVKMDLSLKLRVNQVRKRVNAALKNIFESKEGYFVLSAEELVRTILMQEYQITEKDLKDYENRPRGLAQMGLLISGPVIVSKKGGKFESCSAFLSAMEVVKTAFNSLTENPLLKMWEYSVASFAETKPGFTRWNMYASLGFNSDQKGGIAHCLYQDIKSRLDEANAKVRDLQGEYEMVYAQLKFVEGRLRQASTEKEAQWGRIEYESKRGEFRTLEEIRDREHFKAERFANLLTDLLEKYDEFFPKYFQEVYDADMHEVLSGPYDDSPAGFRLLFKHGRENTSQWTLIYTPQEFIEYLSSFFVMTEPQIVNDPLFEGLTQELSAIITTLVSHIKTDEFLISAFERMAAAHNTQMLKNPLEHLDRIDKKPWAYTAGGTMHNLMLCYFRLDEKPKEVDRWVENELELLVFFIDTIKQMPFTLSEKYLASQELSLLIHSPTHAFTFRPGFPLLKKAIEAEGFSYTWTRDNLVRPAENFIEYMFLDQETMGFFLEKLSDLIPESYRLRFSTLTNECYGRKNPPEFRKFILEALERDRLLQIEGQAILAADQIDSLLFHLLPLTSRYEMKNRAEKLLENLPGLSEEMHKEISSLFDEMIERWGKEPFLTAQGLQDLCKASLCIALNSTSTEYDYPYLISQNAQKLGYAMPTPILFGDTNWVKDLFAFVVNPGTASLELWRVDPLGRVGHPMSQWKQWLNGSERSRTWGIFTKPQEYH